MSENKDRQNRDQFKIKLENSRIIFNRKEYDSRENEGSRRKKRRKKISSNFFTNLAKYALLFLIAASPFALGVSPTHHEVELGFRIILIIATLAFFLGLKIGKNAPINPGPFFWILMGIGVFALLQAVPLPYWLAKKLAPMATEMRDAVYVGLADGAGRYYAVSADLVETIDAAVRWFCLAMIFLMGANLFSSRGGALQLFKVIGLTAGGVVLAGLAHLVLGMKELYGFVEWWPFARGYTFASVLRNGNALAIYLAIGSLALGAVGLMTHSEKEKRVLWLLLSLTLGFFSIISVSRGAIIVYFAAVLAAFAIDYYRGPDRRILKWWIVAPIAAIAAGIFFAAPFLSKDVAPLADANNIANISKFPIWQKAWPLLKENPIIGIGAGSFQFLYFQFSTGLHEIQRTLSVENMPYQWMIDFGVPVGLLISGLFLYIIYRAFQPGSHTYQKFAGLIVAAIFAHNLVDYNLTLGAVYLPVFLLMGVICVTTKPEREKTNLEAAKKLLRLRRAATLYAPLAMFFVILSLGVYAYYASLPKAWAEAERLAKRPISEEAFKSGLAKLIYRHGLDGVVYDFASKYYLDASNKQSLEKRAAMLEKALYLQPNQPQINMRLGLTYLRLKQERKASFNLMAAFANSNMLKDAYKFRLELYGALRSFKMDPVKIFKTFTDDKLLASVALSDVIFKDKNYDAAAEMIERGKRIYGEAPFLLVYSAIIQREKGNVEEAIYLLKQAEAEVRKKGSKAETADVFAQIGRFYAGLKMYKEAEQFFKDSLSADKKNVDSWTSYIAALAGAGKNKEAKDAIKDALIHSGRRDVIFKTAGDLLMREGAFADAAKNYSLSASLAAAGYKAAPLEGLVRAYVKLGNFNEAKAHLRELNNLGMDKSALKELENKIAEAEAGKNELKILPQPSDK